MESKMRPKFLLIFFLLSISCNDNLNLSVIPESQNSVIIQALLITSQTEQRILITKSQSPGQEKFEVPTINNAQVLINRIPFQNILPHKFDYYNPYNYSTKMKICPGNVYELLVVIDSDTILGQTQVPDNSNISCENNIITWTRSKHAYLYRIIGNQRGGGEYSIAGTTTSDTCYHVLAHETDLPTGFYDIKLFIFDQAYFQYISEGQNRVNLEGKSQVYGFFGSVNIINAQIKLTN
jgi:hypothetical protein